MYGASQCFEINRFAGGGGTAERTAILANHW